MKTDTYKKLISIFMALALFVSASVLAFADDDSAKVPDFTSGSDAELSEVENEFLSKSTSESDFEVRKAIINSVRSVAPPTGNETASDIYELLYTCWTSINLHYSLYVYDDQNYSVNDDIRTAINAIVSSLNGSTESSTGDIWNLLKQIVIALTLDKNSNVPGDYTINHNVDLISQFIASGLFDSNQNPFLKGISSNLTTVSSNLASQMNQIIVIRNNIDSIKSNVDFIEGYTEYISEATEMVIVPRIKHIDDDLHDILNYLDSIVNYNIISEQSDTITNYTNYKYISNNRSGAISTWSNNYRYINFSGNNAIFAPYIPIIESDKFIENRQYAIVLEFPDITFTGNGNTSGVYFQGNSLDLSAFPNRLSNYFLYPYVSQDGHKLYYIPFHDSNTNLNNAYNALVPGEYLGIYCSSVSIPVESALSNGNYDCNVYTVDTTSVRYEVLKHIDNDLHLGYDILNTFKELYASDDLINAKENQKELEDSVIEDFTGSGSASASLSDAIDIKGVQSSIKGSLNTGNVNASGLSTILNTSSPSSDSSFFKFWTQDVYNDVNGLNNIPQTRGGDTYIFLNDSEELERLIRGQSW